MKNNAIWRGKETVEIVSGIYKSHYFKTCTRYFVIDSYARQVYHKKRSWKHPLRQGRHCSPQVSSPAVPSWSLKAKHLKFPCKRSGSQRKTKVVIPYFKTAPSYTWLTSRLSKEQRPQKRESHQGDVTDSRKNVSQSWPTLSSHTFGVPLMAN